MKAVSSKRDSPEKENAAFPECWKKKKKAWIEGLPLELG